MNITMNLIRKTLRNRWALAALALIAVVGIVWLVWGVMGLAYVFGGVVSSALLLLFGESKPWTDEDQTAHDRRWKWDGSNNDDGLNN